LPETLGRPDFDGGRKLDFAAIILIGGRDGTKGLPAGVSATSH
jgi:ribosomal protein S5